MKLLFARKVSAIPSLRKLPGKRNALAIFRSLEFAVFLISERAAGPRRELPSRVRFRGESLRSPLGAGRGERRLRELVEHAIVSDEPARHGSPKAIRNRLEPVRKEAQ